MDILWRVFHILTAEPVPYTFATRKKRENSPQISADILWRVFSFFSALQTYTEPVPPLKYEKLATQYPQIYMDIFTA